MLHGSGLLSRGKIDIFVQVNKATTDDISVVRSRKVVCTHAAAAHWRFENRFQPRI